jgi:4-amino-4-deoxy-L-arabinose transferase-like glycosyltransferase
MEESVESAREKAEPHTCERLADLKTLAWLLVLTLGLRGWMLWRTEVTARDSIGFIRYALELENPDMMWSQVLCKNHQHPGYPLAILAASWPIRYFLGGITPFNMQLSAQLASALAALFLVVPMFYLGKAFGGRFAGFWSALLFQCLPVSGHILADGISEPVYLFLFACGLLVALRALQGGSAGRFALAGALCGLSYLTRPEGALLLAATCLVLVGFQAIPALRRTWPQFLTCAASLIVTALTVGSIYFLATGRFTNKPNIHIMNPIAEAGERGMRSDTGEALVCLPRPTSLAPRPARGPVFAAIWGANLESRGLTPCLWLLGTEVVQSFHYVGMILVLLGMWWNRRLCRTVPGVWLLFAVCLLYVLVLCRLALVAGYVSDRHVMVLVMCGTYPAVLGLRDLPFCWRLWRSTGGSLVAASRPATAWSLAALILLVGYCLPKTLQPLHANRQGHHAAGLWLGEHVKDGDEVQDDHAWAHYYAGQVFHETDAPPCGAQAKCYTVIGRSRDPNIDAVRQDLEQQLKSAGATIVYYWPPARPVDSAKVVVYETLRNARPGAPPSRD